MTDDVTDNVSTEALTAEEQQAWDEMRSEPAPKEEPKPEVKAEEPKVEEPKAEEKEPEVEKLVKHGAFEEERQRRKKAQQEAQFAREEAARLKGQLEALQGGKQVTPEQQTAETDLENVDIEKDPIGALKAMKAKMAEAKAEADKVWKEQTEHVRISAIGKRHAERFAMQQPHFFDGTGEDGKPAQGAYTFMRQLAAQRLQSQYPNAPAEYIIDAVNAVERKHIQDCLESGDNAAEKLWELAVEAGYKAPVKAPPRDEGGKFTKPAPTEAERIEKLEKAQKAATSLGSISGGGGESELSLEALADMDEDEFAAATKGDRWNKLHRKGVI